MRAIQSSTLSHLKCTIKIFDTYHIEEEFAMSPCFSVILIVVTVIDDLEIYFFDSYLATLNNTYKICTTSGEVRSIRSRLGLMWIIYNQLSKTNNLFKQIVSQCLFISFVMYLTSTYQ
jgi:hypothetical protein